MMERGVEEQGLYVVAVWKILQWRYEKVVDS